VMLTATAADGRPLFRGPVEAPAPSADGAAGAPAATGASVNFSTEPGPIELRIVVQNAAGQTIDSVTQTVTVPDYGKAGVAFGTPRVYRGRTARDILLARNNPDAIPTVSREFSRAERLFIRFDAYAPGGARPDVTARLLNRAGTSMAEVPVQAAEGKPFQIDFPLASLGAGEYVIEIQAKAGTAAAQQLIGFKVGS
jgi:hypothetical protein